MITVGLWIAGKGVISPVPPDNAIKIIFISPTPGTGNAGVTPEIRVSPEIIP
jgi:hypothetical protein